MLKKVAVIMGSDSDLPVLEPCIKRLKALGIETEAHVMSAHRTPAAASAFAGAAREKGFGAIIAAAGKAAHLAGVLAAHTTLPVIGVPVKSSTLDGLDALSDAAAEENRVARDPEILESNDTVIKDAAELYEYIANYKEVS